MANSEITICTRSPPRYLIRGIIDPQNQIRGAPLNGIQCILDGLTFDAVKTDVAVSEGDELGDVGGNFGGGFAGFGGGFEGIPGDAVDAFS
jgi:hypothetical protein